MLRFILHHFIASRCSFKGIGEKGVIGQGVTGAPFWVQSSILGSKGTQNGAQHLLFFYQNLLPSRAEVLPPKTEVLRPRAEVEPPFWEVEPPFWEVEFPGHNKKHYKTH